MTATEKLARELFQVWLESAISTGCESMMKKWEHLGSCCKDNWISVARHVLRRETKLRKAKR